MAKWLLSALVDRLLDFQSAIVPISPRIRTAAPDALSASSCQQRLQRGAMSATAVDIQSPTTEKSVENGPTSSPILVRTTRTRKRNESENHVVENEKQPTENPVKSANNPIEVDDEMDRRRTNAEHPNQRGESVHLSASSALEHSSFERIDESELKRDDDDDARPSLNLADESSFQELKRSGSQVADIVPETSPDGDKCEPKERITATTSDTWKHSYFSQLSRTNEVGRLRRGVTHSKQKSFGQSSFFYEDSDTDDLRRATVFCRHDVRSRSCRIPRSTYQFEDDVELNRKRSAGPEFLSDRRNGAIISSTKPAAFELPKLSPTKSIEVPRRIGVGKRATICESGLSGEKFDNDPHAEPNLYVMGVRMPRVLRAALKKSILSPLLACFAVGSLYLVLQFYTIFIYLTKYHMSVTHMLFTFLLAFLLRLILAPAVHFSLNFCKKKRWFEVKGRKIISIFGTLTCLSFLSVFHPWQSNFGVLELCVSLVLFEIGVENLLFELSRVFELQQFLSNGISTQLNILEEISLTSCVFVICLIQIFSRSTLNVKAFEVSCLFVVCFAAGCFLFSVLFYPSRTQLKMCEGRKQLVANVSEIHRRMANRLARVVTSNGGRGRESVDESAVVRHESKKNWLWLWMQLKRLLVNPHFAWPLVARSARQSRITVNTGFLLLFTHIYFVTAGAFSDTGMRMNLFFMLCLTLHTVVSRLLWDFIRDSGPIVLNIMLCGVSILAGILIFISGRHILFFVIVYMLLENVLSRTGAQISFTMFEAYFQAFDEKNFPNRKAISKRKLAFLNSWLANCTEYLTLALLLFIISSTQFRNFVGVDSSVPFSKRCEAGDLDVGPVTEAPPPLLATESTIFEEQTTVSAFNESRTEPLPRSMPTELRVIDSLMSTLAHAKAALAEISKTTVDNLKNVTANFNVTSLSEPLDGVPSLVNEVEKLLTEQVLETENGLSVEEKAVELDARSRRKREAAGTTHPFVPFSHRSCKETFDMTLFLAVICSISLASLEFFAMKMYRKHFTLDALPR